MKKTNAMRALDALELSYQVLEYDSDDGKIDGISVAHKVGEDPQYVYKTLVTQGSSGGIYVMIIPVEQELDLKKAAKVSGEKSLSMLPVKDITKYTGYIRGGCSPLAMKKHYPTWVDEQLILLDAIIVSGGQIGLQIKMPPEALLLASAAQVADLVK